MVEGSWNRRPHGVPALIRIHATPPWISAKTVAGGHDERPSSVCSSLSELQFVSEEDTTDPQDTGSYPSPSSQISQLQFASPEEATTPTTPIEFGPLSRKSSLSFSTDSSSPGAHEGQAWMTPSEQFPLMPDTSSVLPQRPGWAVTGPLPEVPGHAQYLPSPSKPEEMATDPGWRCPDQFSYHRSQEFVQGCSSIASRPSSDPGTDTWNQSVEEKRAKGDTTSEDTPPVHHAPAPLIILPPAASPIPPSSPPPSPMFPLHPATSIQSFVDLLPPTSIDIVTAAATTITGENGGQILFGALFRDRRVVVILVRHFWCLCCQDYVRSILNSVTPEILGRRGVDLVLIGNGMPGAIKVYKSMS